MDSDDNCLVIDESIADMEVSSTSETPAPKDVCEIENHNENEADSSVVSSFLPAVESTTTMVLNLSTKKSTHRDGDHGHTKEKGKDKDKEKDKDKDKEKDRHREKRRSKDERRKTGTPSSSEKHRSLSRKSNCIPLKEAMFKEKILNVSQIDSIAFEWNG